MLIPTETDVLWFRFRSFSPFVTRLLLTIALVGSIAYTVCSGSSPSRHLLGILLWRQSFLYLLQVHGHTLRAIRSVHGLVMTSEVFHLVISNFWKLQFFTIFNNFYQLINFSNIFQSQVLYIEWSHLKMCWATANPLQRGFFRLFSVPASI